MIPLDSTESAAGALVKVRYTHDAMIDMIIAKPDVLQNDIAAYFGYSVGWISRIMCSDAFQARLATRRGEVVIPGLLATFEERLKAMTTRSLDLIMEKMEAVDEEGNPAVEVGTLFKAMELGSKCLGYGARQTNVAIQNNMTVNTMTDSQLMEVAQGG